MKKPKKTTKRSTATRRPTKKHVVREQLTLADVIGSSSRMSERSPEDLAALLQSPEFDRFLRTKLGLSRGSALHYGEVRGLLIGLGLSASVAEKYAFFAATDFTA